MKLQEAINFLKSRDELRITVTGDIGSGKSTFSKHLSEILEVPRIYIGEIMREEAAKRGLTLLEFGKLQEKDDTIDRLMDDLQQKKSKKMPKGVFEGRTAWHFVHNPHTNVFLSVDEDEAVKRILKDDNPKRDKFASLEDIKEKIHTRKQSEILRYRNYYDIDVYDHDNFNVIIDTTFLSIKDVFEKTIIAIAQHIKTL